MEKGDKFEITIGERLKTFTIDSISRTNKEIKGQIELTSNKIQQIVLPYELLESNGDKTFFFIFSKELNQVIGESKAKLKKIKPVKIKNIDMQGNKDQLDFDYFQGLEEDIVYLKLLLQSETLNINQIVDKAFSISNGFFMFGNFYDLSSRFSSLFMDLKQQPHMLKANSSNIIGCLNDFLNSLTLIRKTNVGFEGSNFEGIFLGSFISLEGLFYPQEIEDEIDFF